MTFKPMLAVDFEEQSLRFPYFISPKLDGLRGIVVEGRAKTRSMKAFPNQHVDEWFREHGALLNGLDGELIVGDPTAPDCFRRSTSALMSIQGRPDFTFYAFDHVDLVKPFTERVKLARAKIENAGLKNAVWLPNQGVEDRDEMMRFEEKFLDLGYEGAMLRAPGGRYKQGRATLREGTLLKVKRHRDAEAVIVGTEEQQQNTNVATKNELDRTHRSTAQAGMVGKGTLGAFIVRGAAGQPFAGAQFRIGTGLGLDDALRASLWGRRGGLPGLVIKYRYFDVGIKDRPRHPIFLGFRQEGT